jgi:Ca2+-binding EF-hand superfamily protein
MVVNADTNQPEKSTVEVAPTSAAEKAEQEKKLAIATEAAKQLLLAMDTDKNGKISKREWMKFVEEEFNRLDVNHDGELDVKELTQSRMRVHAYVGK